MPNKKCFTLCLTAVLAAAVVFAGTSLVAAGACGEIPYKIIDFDEFIDSKYFNDGIDGRCEELTVFEFEGNWYVVAIATEAGHTNQVKVDSRVIFDNKDCSNWGLYTMVDFDSENLTFVDTNANSSYQKELNPFNANGAFRVCQLAADSNELGYLTYPTTLLKGDLIVGFNDSGGDSDFDDLIVALRSRKTSQNPRFDVKVEASKTKFDGEDFCFEWTDLVNCEAVVTDCNTGLKIEGTALSEIDENNSEQAVFFGPLGGGCKVVWIKFGESSTRCAVIGGKKYCQ